MSWDDEDDQRRLQEQREREEAERIAAEKAEAERQQQIEDNLAERGAIRIDGYYPRFREAKYPWEQGYNQRTRD